ncbi:hypothetical protein [Saccharicrinis sp. 156]|uniref:hypothetical protein n=1 Tax=Saccharicrinis sp. 156 TaxID=3417574 RepID=UPI003D356C21
MNSKDTLTLVYMFLAWNIFSVIRGFFIAETYWDWKGLVDNFLKLMVPLMTIVFVDSKKVQSLLSVFMNVGLIVFIILSPFIHYDAFGFFLAPISLILIFLPYIPNKWRVLILFLTFLVFVIDVGARSNIIKFGIPLLLMFIYFSRSIIPKWILLLLRFKLMILPVILFALGVLGIFNIFKMDEYLGEQKQVKTNFEGEVVEEPLTADTRTFIYEEVLYTAQKHNSWLIGRSPARGYESEAFGAWAEANTGRPERLAAEVGVINVFLWNGVIGVILYFLIFWRASYLAIHCSNNIFSKMIGLFVAFRWFYSWIEEINLFTLNYVVLWMMIGICFSRSFRKMDDLEVKFWVQGIFNKKYRIVDTFLNFNSYSLNRRD